VIATDLEPRAVACARENLARLGVADAVEVLERDLFPDDRADLLVANPPWVPADAHGPLDRAIYDPAGALLARLHSGMSDHLRPGGEAWLVLSDLPELVGLRPPGALEDRFTAAGLRVVSALTTTPSHPRARDAADPLAAARARERTTLYVLAAATPCSGT
jgi:methylase of polypeptide subunit release factors